MRKLILKILLRLYEGKVSYKDLSEKEVNTLLGYIAKDEYMKKFPAFLDQCSNQFRNQFLYTGDETYKGAVMAFSRLKEQILERRKTKKKKKNLTDKEKNGKIKPIY